ncbi:transcriptional regulator, TetR family [Pseudooceanicola antarcticus]|uniref:TetR/AcrR family transcriptional regulator n=1 Tax=Pseudooceanicola antarcticus TaxID=1247613 RepID=A0A285HTV5_9RHOB|nr:TetR/AcrR family transcriptional regulator [Pseudooceanicola antarcticus]PJE27536.1 TetR/AcrR family transcriptional regulator [Pseudooceanicola antarcticus]SNY39097.1 transcriptional regulator, TetR family [Pseudooceanicola antarcticus]
MAALESIRKARRADGKVTQARILTSAEYAFSTAPYDAISLRKITSEADVNLALVKYYFNSKENLYTAVVTRRATELRVRRLEMLEALPGDRPPKVEEVLNAFMRPLLDKVLSGDPAWYCYLRILGFMGTDERFDGLMAELFDPTAKVFFAALRDALPEADPADLAHGMSFVILLMLRALVKEGRTPILLGEPGANDDLEAVYARLLPFCAAGVREAARPR